MNKVVGLLTIILFCHSVQGQNAPGRPDIAYPQEILKVHLSQTSLFPGEVLAFKIYCTNPLFPSLELSRIAFIELVNDLNVPVLRKKILLEHGAGEGQFVLPGDMSSGIYTVLSYTNWMKNFGEETFDRQPVLIVNPDQSLAQYSDTSRRYQNSCPPPGTNGISRSGLELTPDKEKYGTREQVSLKVKLNSEEGRGGGGSFSVSVCYTEPAFSGYKRKNLRQLRK